MTRTLALAAVLAVATPLASAQGFFGRMLGGGTLEATPALAEPFASHPSFLSAPATLLKEVRHNEGDRYEYKPLGHLFETTLHGRTVPQLSRQTVGLGGLLLVHFQQRQVEQGGLKWSYKRNRYTKIDNVQGSLFPLAAGNRMSFNYAEELIDGALYFENTGSMAFEVTNRWATSEYAGYVNHPRIKELPGEIFEIRRTNPLYIVNLNNKNDTHRGTNVCTYLYSTAIRYVFAMRCGSDNFGSFFFSHAFTFADDAEGHFAQLRAAEGGRAKAELDAAQAKSAALGADDRAKAQGLFRQAFSLFQSGDFAAAILQFDRGLALDPANTMAHYYLAETHVRAKNNSLARRHFLLAKQFGGESSEAAKAEARLAELK